uniref:Uncharacterized protein n=1 Tax=Desertifilum tharense IPPAS B-1220 TaxID=1781255 RepID=A0ACD5GVH2_9CYAN
MRHLTQFLPLSAVLASLLGGSLCAIAQEIEPLSPELSTVAETESEPASSETVPDPLPRNQHHERRQPQRTTRLYPRSRTGLTF